MTLKSASTNFTTYFGIAGCCLFCFYMRIFNPQHDKEDKIVLLVKLYFNKIDNELMACWYMSLVKMHPILGNT